MDEHVKVNDQHRGQSNVRILPNETFASAGNKSQVTKNHYHTTVKDTRSNNLAKNNKANYSTGPVVIKPTSGVYSSNSGKDKKNNDTKNFAGATGGQPNNEIPHGQAFQTEHEDGKIENIETAEFTRISSLLATFITSRPRADVDSFFLQNLRNAVSSVASSKKEKVKSLNKNGAGKADFGIWLSMEPAHTRAGHSRLFQGNQWEIKTVQSIVAGSLVKQKL